MCTLWLDSDNFLCTVSALEVLLVFGLERGRKGDRLVRYLLGLLCWFQGFRCLLNHVWKCWSRDFVRWSELLVVVKSFTLTTRKFSLGASTKMPEPHVGQNYLCKIFAFQTQRKICSLCAQLLHCRKCRSWGFLRQLPLWNQKALRVLQRDILSGFTSDYWNWEINKNMSRSYSAANTAIANRSLLNWCKSDGIFESAAVAVSIVRLLPLCFWHRRVSNLWVGAISLSIMLEGNAVLLYIRFIPAALTAGMWLTISQSFRGITLLKEQAGMHLSLRPQKIQHTKRPW